MADTRINALSTATVSLSDDFLPIDGTTAGTKKLSAFNPSFGGNATVGGTLTATGTGSHVFGTTNTVTLSSGAVTATGIVSTTAAAQRVVNTTGAFQIYKDATPSIAARFTLNTAAADTAAIGVYNGSSWTDPLQVNTTQVLVTTSTASTSTSSGALVVSGGVGVGGAGYFGGLLNISSTAGLYAQWKKTDNASGSQSWAWITNNDGTLFLQAANDNFVGANNYLSFARSGVTPGTTTIHGTTASTGTSSGALVVSGGVGVAGAVFSGGYVHPGGDSGFYIRGTGSSNGLITGAIVSVDTSANFRVRNAAGSSTYLDVDSSNVTISSGVGLKLGNAYVAGAPTATGYIVIKDSTGTSYKIPAVAL